MKNEGPQVNEVHLDTLRELANIGVGNAATALSKMLGEETINMKVPQVAVEQLQEVPEHLGDPEDPVSGVYFEAYNRDEDITLIFLFVLPLDSVNHLIHKLLPQGKGCHESAFNGENADASEDALDMGEMELSMLMEVGNIVAGGYLSALSFMTNLTLLSSPPQMAVDMSGAIVGTVIAETRLVDEYLILLKTTIHSEHHALEGNVLILPDEGSLNRIFKLLGIE